MSRPFFFGGTQSQQQSQYLVQMKAGKMVRNGNTVSPIKDKKGLVYMHQSADDNLMHFCWKDRTSGQLEDDLIIFPDDAEFLKVTQCTTGRVFVLKFKTSPRRLFFWSQEPKDDKDDEIVAKINEYINNPSAASRASARSGGNSSGSSGSNNHSSIDIGGLQSDEEFRNLFSSANVSAQQLMSMLDAGLAVLPPGSGLASLLGSVQQQNSSSTTPQRQQSITNASTTGSNSTGTTNTIVTSASGETASSAGSGSSTPGLRLADLQNIISGLGQQSERDSDLNVDLSSSINMDVLRPLLSNEDFMKQVKEMLPNVGSENEDTKQLFTDTIHSPQFQQALNSFSHALESGQLGPLIQQFGLPEPCVMAANAGNLESFVKALQQQHKKTDDKAKPSTKSDKKDNDNDKPDDDAMALD